MTGVMTPGTGAHFEASPVLAEWFVGWNDALGKDDRESLRPYVGRLEGSRGTIAQEIVRQWLVIDWLMRVAVPTWLGGAGLVDHADRLVAHPAVDDRRLLRSAALHLEAAARAAKEMHQTAWTAVAKRADLGTERTEPRSMYRPGQEGGTGSGAAWNALADGTRAAIPPASRLVGPACRATGYGLENMPYTWLVIAEALTSAVGIVAWTAAGALVVSPGWSRRVSSADARSSALAAVQSALEPVQAEFTVSAHLLVERLFAVTERSNGH